VVMLFASPCTDTLRDAVRALPGVVGAGCASPARFRWPHCYC